MSRTGILISILSVFLVLTSCVSKKKFTEMQNGRLNAEEQVRRLSDENNNRAKRIEVLISDFEAMKNEMMQSNALKDNHIDSLKKEVYNLNETLSENEQSLKETNFNLGFEKQQLNVAIAQKDQTIRTLEARMAQLDNEITAKSSLADQVNFDKNQLQERITLLQAEKNSGDTKLAALQTELDKVKAETTTLKRQITEKDAVITRLENNVALLKKELGR
jgi:chromosome segregation ATPase